MTKDVIWTDRLMVPIAHFSHAARMAGLIHVGATAGTDAGRSLAGSTPGRVDVADQTKKMFENLETALGLLGAGFTDVVRVKTYVADPRDIPIYWKHYEEHFAEPRPSHALVGSWGFPLPQAAIELDAIAVVGTGTKRLTTTFEPGPCPFAGFGVGDTHYGTAVPLDGEGRLAVGNPARQSRQALDNLSAMLTAVGLTHRDVVNLHVTLSDIRDFPAYEAAFREMFGAPYPSGTVVGAPLQQSEMLIQVESVAVTGGGQVIEDPDWPDVLGWASPAIAAGDILYISGHIGVAAGDVMPAGPEAQTRAAWDGVRRLIDRAGFSLDSVLRTNNVLTDWRSYADFNAGYGANVSDPYPPRATVLGCLLDHRALVQVEAIAHARGGQATILQAASFR